MKSLRKPLIVSLVGLDGTGKTTHAYSLLRRLRSRGVKCKYVWFRDQHMLTLPFLAFFRVVGLTRSSLMPNGRVYRERTLYLNRAVSAVWPWLVLLDVELLFLHRVVLPTLVGTLVILDRSIIDMLVDLTVSIGEYDFLSSRLGRIYIALSQWNSVTIALETDEDTILQRKNDVPSKDYLRARSSLYQNLYVKLKIPRVKTGRPLSEVDLELMEILGLS